jgi:hypothetical protein
MRWGIATASTAGIYRESRILFSASIALWFLFMDASGIGTVVATADPHRTHALISG